MKSNFNSQSIRPATLQDANSLATFWHDGWHASHASIVPPEFTAARTQSSFNVRVIEYLDKTRVLENDGEIIAFNIIKNDELHQFYVAQEFHGRGIAKIMMNDAIDCLRANGVKRAWLACSINNERAAQFYKKSGWQFMREERFIPDAATKNIPLIIWRFEKDLASTT